MHVLVFSPFVGTCIGTIEGKSSLRMTIFWWCIFLSILSFPFRSVADASEKDLITLGFQVSEDLSKIFCFEGNAYCTFVSFLIFPAL